MPVRPWILTPDAAWWRVAWPTDPCRPTLFVKTEVGPHGKRGQAGVAVGLLPLPELRLVRGRPSVFSQNAVRKELASWPAAGGRDGSKYFEAPEPLGAKVRPAGGRRSGRIPFR